MTFEQALQAMREGKKVRRPGWDEGIYYYFDGGWLALAAADDLPNLSRDELFATDWQIVDDPSKPDLAADPDRIRANAIEACWQEVDALKERVTALEAALEPDKSFEDYYDKHLQEQYTAKSVDPALCDKECCKAVCQEEAKPFEMHLVGKVSWWPPVTVGQDDAVTVNLSVKPTVPPQA